MGVVVSVSAIKGLTIQTGLASGVKRIVPYPTPGFEMNGGQTQPMAAFDNNNKEDTVNLYFEGI